MTSIGVTTATASVTPAASPAKEVAPMSEIYCYSVMTDLANLTKESGLSAHLTLFICQQLLVPLVGCETDSHLRHNSSNDRTQTFV